MSLTGMRSLPLREEIIAEAITCQEEVLYSPRFFIQGFLYRRTMTFPTKMQETFLRY